MSTIEPIWRSVGAIEDFGNGSIVRLQVEDQDIAVYRVDDVLYATSNICSHAYALLSDGFLEGHEIECPLHFGRFDIRSGKALCDPVSIDVKTYEVRTIGCDVQVNIR